MAAERHSLTPLSNTTGRPPSQIPRRQAPRLSTDVESWRNQLSQQDIQSSVSPKGTSTTPDAYAFYASQPNGHPSTSTGRTNRRSASAQTLSSPQSSAGVAGSPLQQAQPNQRSVKDLAALFNTSKEQSPSPSQSMGSTATISPSTGRQNPIRMKSDELRPRYETLQAHVDPQMVPMRASSQQRYPAEEMASSVERDVAQVRSRRSSARSSATPTPSTEHENPYQPLFGEVTDHLRDRRLGYGIDESRVRAPRQRMSTDGTAHGAGALPHNRSQSDIPRTPVSTWGHGPLADDIQPSRSEAHTRSASEQASTARDGPAFESLRNILPSNSLQILENYRTQSRLPVRSPPRTADPSALPDSSTDSLSSIPTTNVNSPQVLLTSRRYEPNVKSPSSNAPRLKAVITASPPKQSPPLRTSRDRQPIASVPKSANEEVPLRKSASLRHHRRITDMSEVDMASRRASIFKAVREAELQSRTDESDASQAPQAFSDAPEFIGSQDARPLQTGTIPEESVGPLHLDVNNISQAQSREPLTGTTEFEEDDISPRQSVDTLASSSKPRYSESSDRASLHRMGSDVEAKSAPVFTAKSVLDQVMDMRRRGTQTSTHLTSLGSDRGDDSGTIQIMLGETPLLEKGRFSQHFPSVGNSSQGFSQSRQGSAVADSSFLSPNNRTSQLTVSRMTMDSDAYSVINRVIEQYEEQGVVSPEIIQEFATHIRSDPDLAGDYGNHPEELARAAVNEMLRDHAVSYSHQSPSIALNDPGKSRELPNSASGLSPEEEEQQAWARNVANRTSIHNLQPSFTRGESNGLNPISGTMYPPTNHITTVMRDDKQLDTNAKAPAKATSATHLADLHLGRHADRPALPEIADTGGGLGLAVGPITSRVQTPSSRTPNSHKALHIDTGNHDVESRAMSYIPSFEPIATQELPAPHPDSDLPEAVIPFDIVNSPTIKTPPSEFTIPPNLPPPPVLPSLPNPPLQSVSQSHTQHSSNALNSQASVWSAASAKPSTVPGIVGKDTKEDRRLQQRRNIIKELLDTEFSFNTDMKIIEDIYMGTATACKDLPPDDRKILFGNIPDIVKFSGELHDSLKRAVASVYVRPKDGRWRSKKPNPDGRASMSTSNSSQGDALEDIDDERDRKTTVGQVFNHHLGQMERIYSEYMKNHDNANQRLLKLKQIRTVSVWLHECHTYAADITEAWDLDSLLVKPTQRMLKYPLLLRSLLENTPSNHPDYKDLETAAKELVNVSHRINESKKRAELMDQVINNKTKKDFNLGLAKAFGRRADKLRQQVGLSEAVEDPDYRAIAQKYGTYYVQLQIIMRDFQSYKANTSNYCTSLRSLLDVLEEILDVGLTSSPENESKWRRFIMTVREVIAIAWTDHDNLVQKHCIKPLETLVKMNESTQRLMQKRKKRIVEYAKFKTSKDRGEKVDSKLTEQGEQFMALNDTLKEQLPRLFNLTGNLVEACLKNFVDLQVHWQKIWERKLLPIVEDTRLPIDLDEVVRRFKSDFSFVEGQFRELALLNGSALAALGESMSPSVTTLVNPDGSSVTQRPSTSSASGRPTSLISERSIRPALTPDLNESRTGSFTMQSYTESQSTTDLSTLTASTLYPGSIGRDRSNSSTLFNRSNFAAAPSAHRSTGASRSGSGYRASMESSTAIYQRPISGSTYYTAAHASAYATSTPPARTSEVFSSALPPSDTPDSTRAASPEPQAAAGAREYRVLFVAASLFEFNIDRTRKEAGFPYLTYVPGEIFDVIGQRGELWLAKNQDDPDNHIGWIWEKHFAKVVDM